MQEGLLWKVVGWIQVTVGQGSSFTKTISDHFMAESFEQAVASALTRFPGIELMEVSYRGVVHGAGLVKNGKERAA